MKLEELFVGWYDYPPEEYNNILKNGLISFDTNILLNMYRYSKKASSETFSALSTIKSRIVTSYYVLKEFTNNRKNVKVENIREYENLSSLIDKKISEIDNELKQYNEKKISKISEINLALSSAKEKILKVIEDEKNTKAKFYKKSEIESKISEIFLNQVAPEYDEKSFEEIKKEGLRRFDEKIPPGYMDEEKEENGDYYIFRSLIDYCKNSEKDLIFVTNDNKEDWFRNVKGIREPREELLSEFYKETGKKIIIFNFDDFINNNIIFEQMLSEEVISEIAEINKIHERMSTRGIQRIQKYLYIIAQYDTTDEIKENIEEILKSFRTIMRISEGVQDYPLIRNIERLFFLLRTGLYEEYIKYLKKLNLQIKDYKMETEREIKDLYFEFKSNNSVGIGMLMLEKISSYIRDYLPSTYDNRILLTKSRELRLSKRNESIDDDLFAREITDIYESYIKKNEKEKSEIEE